MYNEETKRNNELVWASVFAHQINQQYDFDYQLVPEHGENSPVDIYMVSKSDAHPQMALQLTHAVELPFIAYDDEAASANYTKQPTIDAIERKHEKLLHQHIDLSQLILVIQGYMNKETAEQVFADSSFKKFKKYEFAGIYYVAPPMLSSEDGGANESLQDGYIVPIKSAFEK